MAESGIVESAEDRNLRIASEPWIVIGGEGRTRRLGRTISELLGFRELLGGPGLKLVEWPDQAGTLLPRPDLRMELIPLADDQRDVMLKACTPTGMALLG